MPGWSRAVAVKRGLQPIDDFASHPSEVSGAYEKAGRCPAFLARDDPGQCFQEYWIPIAFWYISIFSVPARSEAPVTSLLNACM